jgi:ribosome biogenesis GTPase A
MEPKRPPGRKMKGGWVFLQKLIAEADVVVEVVDARDIEGTRLRRAEIWAGSNRLLICVNKCDLLPRKRKIILPGGSAVAISAVDRSGESRKRLLEAIRKRARKLPARGVIVGYPNIGKSAIINLLAGRKAAKVAPVAGTTTGVQWINVSEDIMISDYPGMYPKMESRDDLIRKGAFDVRQDVEVFAVIRAKKALESPLNRRFLAERFSIDMKGIHEPEELLEAIARRRGWLKKGGEPNTEQAASALILALSEAPEM